MRISKIYNLELNDNEFAVLINALNAVKHVASEGYLDGLAAADIDVFNELVRTVNGSKEAE